jgi:site-specific DNA-methyltransferase (adenine-specific)
MYRDYDKEKSDAQYRLHDPDGRAYQLTSLLNPNPNRPNLTYEFKGVTKVWRWTKERMLEEDAKGRIIVPRQGKGIPRYKRYFDEQEGIPIDDFWDDIEFAKGGERLGFPTQKPVELLERIINASSDQGDIVLDPFCGCGTAVIAAERLRRNWIGIDITYLAINLIKNRLRESYPSLVFKVEGEPKDLGAARQLAKESESDGRYQFQWWALTQIGAVAVGGTTANPSVGKKGADRAVDGWLRFAEGSEGHIGKILVQVKSGHVGVKEIREHRDAINRHGASMGIFITLEEPTSEMIKEVKITGQYKSPVWNTEYPKIQILTVEQILKGEKPNIPPISNMFKETSKMERKTETKQQKLS